MAGIADLLTLGLPQTQLPQVYNAPPVQPLPDVMSGVNQAFAQNAALGQQQQQPSKLRNFLGALGDALMVGHGGQPLYRQRMLENQQSTALQGFLTNPDQAIAALMNIPGQAGNAIDLYKAVHPASETPLEVKLYQYEQGLPAEQRGAFEKSIALTHPEMMAPITMGPNDQIIQPGAVSSGPPQSAVEYLKAHPDLAPQFDQKYGSGTSAKILGGATASTPSPTFR